MCIHNKTVTAVGAHYPEKAERFPSTDNVSRAVFFVCMLGVITWKNKKKKAIKAK